MRYGRTIIGTEVTGTDRNPLGTLGTLRLLPSNGGKTLGTKVDQRLMYLQTFQGLLFYLFCLSSVIVDVVCKC